MKSAFFAILFFCTGAYALAQSIMLPGPGLGVTPPSGNSLIFTAASTQYLTATGKTNINQQKFTIATWIKRTTATNAQYFFEFGDTSTSNVVNASIASTASHIEIVANTGGTTVMDLVTTAAYTDTTSWHHFLLAVDTTQATSSNRALLYIDGTVVSSFSTSTYPTQNSNLANNYADVYVIGNRNVGVGIYLNAKVAQFYYIDGQQLTPSSFITGTPGLPMPYTGTYTGHFDFFLPFSNGTSTTTLGADSSGESNNWTLNNMTTANQSTDYP